MGAAPAALAWQHRKPLAKPSTHSRTYSLTQTHSRTTNLWHVEARAPCASGAQILSAHRKMRGTGLVPAPETENARVLAPLRPLANLGSDGAEIIRALNIDASSPFIRESRWLPGRHRLGGRIWQRGRAKPALARPHGTRRKSQLDCSAHGF